MLLPGKVKHRTQRVGWLRAAVLGANDGIISLSSLLLGIAAAHAEQKELLVAAIAGLVSGTMSMAAGEYVSVHSQSDTEKADLASEQEEHRTDIEGEHWELAAIYIERGLHPALAVEVATQLMAHDAIEAHARDEIGISKTLAARPLQAAAASACSFAAGAVLPILVMLVAPVPLLLPIICGCSLLFLILLGMAAARIGGAPIVPSVFRVAFWGAFAMAVTTGVGILFKINA